MEAYAWLIPAGLSLLGGLQGYKAGEDVEGYADQLKLQAEDNKMLETRELNEQVRRQEDEDRRLRGSALARAAASGARVEGTVSGYLDYMAEEQAGDLNWMKTAGASRIRLNYQASKNEADAMELRGSTQKTAAFTQGLMGAVSFMGQGGLFKSPSTRTSVSWTPAITGPK